MYVRTWKGQERKLDCKCLGGERGINTDKSSDYVLLHGPSMLYYFSSPYFDAKQEMIYGLFQLVKQLTLPNSKHRNFGVTKRFIIKDLTFFCLFVYINEKYYKIVFKDFA